MRRWRFTMLGVRGETVKRVVKLPCFPCKFIAQRIFDNTIRSIYALRTDLAEDLQWEPSTMICAAPFTGTHCEI